MEVKITRTPTAIERYIETAKIAGCPADQIERFVGAGYVGLPWALPVHAAARELDDTPMDRKTPIILTGGARGPGKSHLWLAQAGLDDCQRWPGLKGLFLRKIQKAAAESLEDLVGRVFGNIPHEFLISKGRIRFPNGSRILIGGFRHPSEIEKYIGVQYDFLIVEERTQIAMESHRKLMGSVRSSIPGYVPRSYESTNPGGVAHLDIKREFVDPYFEGKTGRGIYFPATYRDNPFLPPQYVTWLEELPGPLGKAWRDGDWSAFEGMAFEQWDYERHVMKEQPTKIPGHWQTWIGVDDGYSAPFCALLITQDPKTRRVYVVDELYQKGLSDTEQARAIKDMWNLWNLRGNPRGFGDPAMWGSKKLADVISTTADEYASEKVYLEKGDNSRITGKRRVDRLLADYPDGLPGLQISPVCVNFIDTIPALPRDENRPEDVDTDAEDHAYDALRYGTTRTDTPVVELGNEREARMKRARQVSPLQQLSREGRI